MQPSQSQSQSSQSAEAEKSSNAYPGIVEFNRRYNNIVKVDGKSEAFLDFVEAVVRTHLNIKEI